MQTKRTKMNCAQRTSVELVFDSYEKKTQEMTMGGIVLYNKCHKDIDKSQEFLLKCAATIYGINKMLWEFYSLR